MSAHSKPRCGSTSRALGLFKYACWLIFHLLLATPFLVCAQLPPRVPPGGLLQLQVAQPTVDVSAPTTATASFDPPVVRPGEKTFYRVTVSATESAIDWPDELPLPAELKPGMHTRGMITPMQVNNFHPQTTFLYELQATTTGHFTITNFSAYVSGTPVEIPAANLDVVTTNDSLVVSRRLALEISDTNVFLGQPFRVRVMLPAGPGNQIEALREIQLNGGSLMNDKTGLRQAAGPASINGELKTVFMAEMVVTPIAAGKMTFWAQGFTAGSEFTPPFSMHGQMSLTLGPAKYILLTSDPVQIQVRPLPMEGELPGFTGAIGKFYHDPAQLSTNRLRVGEPVQLRTAFHSEGDFSRMAPPIAPRSRDWQIIADPPPATSFTLIPLSDDARETPAIPFSYFDPETAKYVDLTIPPIEVTVEGEGLPVELSPGDEEEKTAAPLKLSGLATTPGKTLGSLKPLPLQAWFMGVQLIPLAGFLALWQWDRRRRYLEAHPEIVRRAQARRALRREKHQLQKAVAAGDAVAFVQHAARAMNIAVAPHFPANPQALVGGDVLAQLDDAARTGLPGETVKRVFAAADSQFAGAPQSSPDLPALQAGVDAVLQRLEEKL